MRIVLLIVLSTAVATGVASRDKAPDIQPWNGAALSDWTNVDSAVVLTDMTAAEQEFGF